MANDALLLIAIGFMMLGLFFVLVSTVGGIAFDLLFGLGVLILIMAAISGILAVSLGTETPSCEQDHSQGV